MSEQLWSDEELNEKARRTVTNPIESIAVGAQMMMMRDTYEQRIAELEKRGEIVSNLTGTGKRVKARPPTVGVRRGLRLIANAAIDDFDNSFERLFPSASDSELSDVIEAVEWLEQYAVE